MKLQLLHYWRSSCSWRVRWALEIKKIPCELIPIDLLTDEQKKDPYLKKNPAACVPTLLMGEKTMGESLAIIEWLEETRHQPSLFPDDPFLRACTRRLAETINAGVQPLQNLSVMRHLSSQREKQVTWSQHWIRHGLSTYESLLEKQKKDTLFSMGDAITMADLCLIPQCYNAERFSIALPPRVQRIYKHALSTPECAASHPDRHKP